MIGILRPIGRYSPWLGRPAGVSPPEAAAFLSRTIAVTGRYRSPLLQRHQSVVVLGEGDLAVNGTVAFAGSLTLEVERRVSPTSSIDFAAALIGDLERFIFPTSSVDFAGTAAIDGGFPALILTSSLRFASALVPGIEKLIEAKGSVDFAGRLEFQVSGPPRGPVLIMRPVTVYAPWFPWFPLVGPLPSNLSMGSSVRFAGDCTVVSPSAPAVPTVVEDTLVYADPTDELSYTEPLDEFTF